MKFKFLLGTHLWVYLLELPLVFLLYLSISFSDASGRLLGLYPLATVLVLLIFFIPFYSFKAIEFRPGEVRQFGIFSSRDRVTLDKGKTLIFRLLPRRKVAVEVFGNDGEPPELSWMGDGSGAPVDITMFRGKAFASRAAVARILRFYGCPDETVRGLIGQTDFSSEDDFFRAVSTHADDLHEIRLTFLFTPGETEEETQN